jgi:hypothetical protein
MRKLILIILLTLFSASYNHANALSVETHEAINEYIVRNNMNGFSLDAYLQNNLGIVTGITTSFNSKEVPQWLRDGGYDEDKDPPLLPYIRSANHFHNPLQPIDKAGFSGIWDINHFFSGQSAVLWSQSAPSTQSPGGYYAWSDVRNYFYSALTSTNQLTRNTNFADTFRGLGQLMHLVQDMSVPEHTRNEGHYLKYMYENWVKDNQSDVLNTAFANLIFFNTDVLTHLPSAFANASVPIANLFDTMQYGGNNPDVTVQNRIPVSSPTGTVLIDAIGLAEYTNANFVSPDTLFRGGFRYPAMSSVIVDDATYTVTNPFTGKILNRPYYVKMYDGETGYLLAGVPFLKFEADRVSPVNNVSIHISEEIPIMDPNVYRGYASLLLPRAVGYSAGLLNYFFRGQINLVEPDPNGAPGAYFIKNLSDPVFGEDMSGTFQLYYDDTSDNRKSIPLNGNAGGLTTILLMGESVPVSFTIPTDAQEPGKYILVFRGTMGNEDNAVAGRVVRTWREEWDNGLTGNHNWLSSDPDFKNNFYFGYIKDTVANGTLTKDNSTNNTSSGNINQNWIGGPSIKIPIANPSPNTSSLCTQPGPVQYCRTMDCDQCFANDFGQGFPMLITKDTWLSLKIDDMTSNVPSSCPGWDKEGAYQGIKLSFSVGPQHDYNVTVNFTLAGNEAYYYVNDNVVVPKAQDYSVNIYTMLAPIVELLEPIVLYQINIIQWIHCGPDNLNTNYQQHMVVDYIRVMDR